MSSHELLGWTTWGAKDCNKGGCGLRWTSFCHWWWTLTFETCRWMQPFTSGTGNPTALLWRKSPCFDDLWDGLMGGQGWNRDHWVLRWRWHLGILRILRNVSWSTPSRLHMQWRCHFWAKRYFRFERCRRCKDRERKSSIGEVLCLPASAKISGELPKEPPPP